MEMDDVKSWWGATPTARRQKLLENLRLKAEENPDDVFDQIALAWAEYFERQRTMN